MSRICGKEVGTESVTSKYSGSFIPDSFSIPAREKDTKSYPHFYVVQRLTYVIDNSWNILQVGTMPSDAVIVK